MTALAEAVEHVCRRRGIMIIVMHPSTTIEECAQLLALLYRMIGNGHPLATTRIGEQEVIALEGHLLNSQACTLIDQASTVERLVPVQTTHQLVSRAFKVTNSSIVVGEKLGGQPVATGDARPVIIAGPCAVENREQVLTTARAVKAAGTQLFRGGAFKPWTSLYQFQGLGHDAQMQVFGVQPADRVLQFSSPSFDASIFEIVIALLSGATLVMGTWKQMQVGPPLLRFMPQHAVTLAVLTPSVWAALPVDPLSALRIAMAAGEACPAEVVSKWSSSTRRFFNLYGPAEATVWATYAECKPDGSKPLIGRPIANKRIYILNEQLQPVAIGEPGQICIGGMGIGRYHRRHDLTGDPFSKHKADRLYLTGDVGRWTQEGSIEYLGRQDHQVKIRGQRIEVEGIEQVLARAPGVQACAVVFREGRLVAYLVPHAPRPYAEKQVRAYLQRYLKGRVRIDERSCLL